MAWPSRGYFDQLIHLIRHYLRSERVVRHEIVNNVPCSILKVCGTLIDSSLRNSPT